jgi:hypothetical protein
VLQNEGQNGMLKVFVRWQVRRGDESPENVSRPVTVNTGRQEGAQKFVADIASKSKEYEKRNNDGVPGFLGMAD